MNKVIGDRGLTFFLKPWAFQHSQSIGEEGVKSDPKKKIVIAAQKRSQRIICCPRLKIFKPHSEAGINYLTLASKIKKIVKIAEIDVSFFVAVSER